MLSIHTLKVRGSLAGRRRSLMAAAFGTQTYTNYGAAWQIDQMPPPPLSFRITLANNQVVRLCFSVHVGIVTSSTLSSSSHTQEPCPVRPAVSGLIVCLHLTAYTRRLSS